MAERRRPIGAFPILLVVGGAAAAGAGAYLLASREPSRAATMVAFVPRSLAAEERRWVDQALPPNYMAAPVAPPPCSYGSPDWARPLSEAHRYIRLKRVHEAEVVLTRYLASPAGAQLQNTVGAAVRNPVVDTSNPSNDDVLGAVHLLHTLAYVQLKQNATGPTLLRSLKNPIGYTDLLSRRGVVGPLRGEYTWVRIAIPSPGCHSNRDSLTTYHLYNNLILGYLKNPGYQEPDPVRRAREFDRRYADPADINPLFDVVNDQKGAPPEGREGWRWAISNSERLLRELTWRRDLDSLQVPPWLAVNLAQVLDSVRTDAGPEVIGPLLRQRDALTSAAERSYRSVATEQEEDLALSLARLQLLRAIGGGGPPRVSAWIMPYLGAPQRAAARAVETAEERSRDPDTLATLLLAGTFGDSLGVHDPSRWIAAAREDLARHYALRARAAPVRERGSWIGRARRVLSSDGTAPPELVQLENDGSFRVLLQRYPPLASLLGIILAVPVLLYLAWLLYRRQAVWASYYRMEAIERSRDER